MTQSHLRPCPSCDRHVRVSEGGCPFCGESLSDAFRAAARPRGPGARLSRAALLAFGTGTLTLATACSSSTTPAYGGSPVPYNDASDGLTPDGAVVHDAAVDDTGPPVATPAYGAPGQPVEALDASDASDETAVATPAYGSPVHPAEDASDDAHVGAIPAYGLAPGH